MAQQAARGAVAQLPCKWFYRLPEGNQCWCTERQVDQTTQVHYCTGKWQDCKTYRTTDSTDQWDSC